MADLQEIQLQAKGCSIGDSSTSNNHQTRSKSEQEHSIFVSWKWWFMVSLNMFFVLSGQTVALLLERFYYNEGGNSKWIITIAQSAGFPLLLIPLSLFPSSSPSKSLIIPHVPLINITIMYVILGFLLAGDNLMYSYGISYLPLSTYSLICATQLAFNAVFSFFLNSQKFTPLIVNSVVVLTFSAALLGIQSNTDQSSDIPNGEYALGFVLTLGASATYSLILSLLQITFQKVIKKETLKVVLETQIWMSFIATIVCVIGLFGSGDWRAINGEMKGYGKGKLSYVMTLTWIAIAWQVSYYGLFALIFIASSLFSNAISTLALPVVPIFAVIFFHDKMDGIKILSMLMAIWGFLSYVHQHYIDESKSSEEMEREGREISRVASFP